MGQHILKLSEADKNRLPGFSFSYSGTGQSGRAFTELVDGHYALFYEDRTSGSQKPKELFAIADLDTKSCVA